MWGPPHKEQQDPRQLSSTGVLDDIRARGTSLQSLFTVRFLAHRGAFRSSHEILRVLQGFRAAQARLIFTRLAARLDFAASFSAFTDGADAVVSGTLKVFIVCCPPS